MHNGEVICISLNPPNYEADFHENFQTNLVSVQTGPA